jgi:hypothetical protein
MRVALVSALEARSVYPGGFRAWRDFRPSPAAAGSCRIEKRLRRSQIFIARNAKKRHQLRRSDIYTLFYAAPSGAVHVYGAV